MQAMPNAGAPLLPDHLRAPFLHAGFWRRCAALIIDSFILSVAGILLYVLLALVLILPASAAGHAQASTAIVTVTVLFDLVMIVGQWLYFALCESSRWQATPGKLALGLRVTDVQGRRIGFGRASGRYFGKLLSSMTLCIGYMLTGWTARKQALHDLLAGCCVVRKDGLEAFEHAAADTGAGAQGAATGMPGWAIALVVVGACFFLIVPVAIMAAIAVPAYQNYIVRTQVAEGMALADSAKLAVTAYVANTGKLPPDNRAAGLSAPDAIHGRYVGSVEIANGGVVVTYGARANRAIAGEHLLFRPYGSRDDVQWRCGSPDIEAKYLPTACRR